MATTLSLFPGDWPPVYGAADLRLLKGFHIPSFLPSSLRLSTEWIPSESHRTDNENAVCVAASSRLVRVPRKGAQHRTHRAAARFPPPPPPAPRESPLPPGAHPAAPMDSGQPPRPPGLGTSPSLALQDPGKVLNQRNEAEGAAAEGPGVHSPLRAVVSTLR